MDDLEGLRILEALLFVSPDPLPPQRIAEVLGCDKKEATRLARALGQRYDEQGSALGVEEVAGGYQIRTRPDLGPWVRKLLAARPSKLSRAALETLAIVAYRQPVTRTDVEKIRGVDSSGVLQNLMDRRLVKIMGRMDVPGRPIIYGTTRSFLELFGLADLSQLPTLKEFEEPRGGHARPEGSEEGGQAAQGEGAPEGATHEEEGSAAATAEGETAAPSDAEPEDGGGLDADGG
jgi:segregation and condensation protein B